MTAYITSTGHTASHWAGQHGDAPPRSVTEVMAKYRSWCAEGNPLFTKAETRRVRDLLNQRPGRGQIIPIQGIYGVTVNFEIRTGDIWPGDNDAEELLLQNPHIVFRMPSKIEEILTSDDPDFLEAYCTIQIKHDLVRRSKYTKQRLDEYDLPEQDDMIEYFFDIMANWQNSVAQECLKGILSQCRIPQQISKLPGFACGTICDDTGYDE
ncbi:hypothetical protein N8T08_001823 [Aspergillus melleus]|uniref:Uncharacterized protein n=1 Tax=Aspergillus melleus TaxID=138277 RepID=A0ACC3B997_9EURO|nr:hypothetical protein N8T08_001823 [Aspergillus melleus]